MYFFSLQRLKDFLGSVEFAIVSDREIKKIVASMNYITKLPKLI